MFGSLFFLLFLISCAFADDFSDCADNIATLEDALYDSGSNLYQLHRVFIPPSTPPARFTKVTYSFYNETDEFDGCNVEYVWAIGAFLFFQPPSLFRFTSLHFYYKNYHLDQEEFNLQLPYECRNLVNETLGSCSCEGDNHDLLDILTQQVSFKCSSS